MQTVILPGYSSENKEWADLVALKLTVEDQVRPIFWDHWLDSTQKFNPREKAMLIARHARGTKINIIAKSIGALVAAYLIADAPEQINKVIICGIPLNDISLEEKEDVKKALSLLDKDKLICYQNSSDPHGTFPEVENFLPQGIKLISKPSSDHSYPYFEEFNNFLAS